MSPALLSLSASAQVTGNSESSVGLERSALNVRFEITRNTRQQEWNAFYNSQYTYWDAKVLADFWKQDVSEAKARIGRKILWGAVDRAILDQFLVDARVQALNEVDGLALYAQSSYSYDDAEALAGFWGESTPYEAKLRIERNLILGNEQVVKKALELSKQRP